MYIIFVRLAWFGAEIFTFKNRDQIPAYADYSTAVSGSKSGCLWDICGLIFFYTTGPYATGRSASGDHQSLRSWCREPSSRFLERNGALFEGGSWKTKSASACCVTEYVRCEYLTNIKQLSRSWVPYGWSAKIEMLLTSGFELELSKLSFFHFFFFSASKHDKCQKKNAGLSSFIIWAFRIGAFHILSRIMRDDQSV